MQWSSSSPNKITLLFGFGVDDVFINQITKSGYFYFQCYHFFFFFFWDFLVKIFLNLMIFYRQVLFVLLFIFLSHSYPFNFPSQVSFLADPNSRRSCLCSIFPTASLLCLVYFIGSAFIAPNYKEVVAIICFTLNIFFLFFICKFLAFHSYSIFSENASCCAEIINMGTRW